ncbi:MAG: hypothetical protein QXT73_08760 [Candidatus Methanomethylicaceae archaeon]
MVNFEETGPIEPVSHTLQSKARPVDGGFQITFVNSFGSAACTLGFNAIRTGVSGFVTNSHCTHPQRMGVVDNTAFHQPTVSGTTNLIGTETVDPPFFSFPACPTGRRCRYSDSAFAQYDISKIGKTTGWTQGRVVAVCQNVNLGWTTDLTLLCQHRVRANVAPGDSGSPVFKITNSPRSGDVMLYGILWGRRQPYPWDLVDFWFSSIFDVESSYSELGSLTICAPGFSC